MYTIDDPMLALILRFVGCSRELRVQDENFLQEQVKAIREYVKDCAPEERQARALEWVEKHARGYRDRWTQEVLDQMFSDQRCPDCPLPGTGLEEICQIHEQWLALLRRYAAEEISDSRYVGDSLALLGRHKELLRASPVMDEALGD